MISPSAISWYGLQTYSKIAKEQQKTKNLD